MLFYKGGEATERGIAGILNIITFLNKLVRRSRNLAAYNGQVSLFRYFISLNCYIKIRQSVCLTVYPGHARYSNSAPVAGNRFCFAASKYPGLPEKDR